MERDELKDALCKTLEVWEQNDDGSFTEIPRVDAETTLAKDIVNSLIRKGWLSVVRTQGWAGYKYDWYFHPRYKHVVIRGGEYEVIEELREDYGNDAEADD